jgi:hypothetical protein
MYIKEHLASSALWISERSFLRPIGKKGPEGRGGEEEGDLCHEPPIAMPAVTIILGL